MRLSLALIIVAITLCGCSHDNSGQARSNAAPSEMAKGQAAKDTVDKDFVADIVITKDKNVFRINIKRVNSSVDKVISNHEAVFADLELKDSKGKPHTGKVLEKTYAEDVNYEFDPTDATPELPNKSGRVRLLTKKLKPGTYEVIPKVRIVEKGKDAVYGPYSDMGSIAVPAGNSIKVNIK